MENQTLLNHPVFKRTIIFSGFLLAAFFISKIFNIGTQFIYSVITPLVSLYTCYLFIRASANKKDIFSRTTWGWLALAFGLWSIANISWMIAGNTFENAMYLVLVWIIGFIPVYIAFIRRYRTLRITPSPRQKWIITAVSLVWIMLAVVFVIRPVVISFDPQHLVEVIFNLLYSCIDLGLVVLSSLMFILLRQGRYTLSWRIILAGLFLSAFADLLLSYLNWQQIYNPNTSLTYWELLPSTLYLMSYLVTSIGITVHGLVMDNKETFVLKIQTAPSSTYHSFISLDDSNQVISASDNFFALVNAQPDTPFYKKPFEQVIGISPAVLQPIRNKLLFDGVIRNEPATLTTHDGQPRPVWMTGIVINDPEGRYSGANFAINAALPVPQELSRPRNPEIAAMLNHLLRMAGSLPQDENNAMRAYFLETIRLFSSLLYQFGGPALKDTLFATLQQTIQQQNLPVTLDNDLITIPEEYSGETLACLLTPLLQSARRFVVDLVGQAMLEEEIVELEKQISPSALQDLDKYHLRSRLLATA